MQYQNEIDSAIGIVKRPTQGLRTRATNHEKRDVKKPNYYPTPPSSTRTFSFIVSSEPSNSKVLGFDLSRRNLMIQNLGANSVYMSVGSQAGFDGSSYSDAIEIPAGTAYEFPANSAPSNDVYVVSSAANLVTVMESRIA